MYKDIDDLRQYSKRKRNISIPEPAFHSPNTFWYLLGAAIAVIWFWIFCLFFLSL